MYSYRVFVSYSRDDRLIVGRFVEALEEAGLRVVWDKNIQPGERFSDIIKHGIAHAHVFIPMLTAKGVKRPWVHQETGYAMGLNVPVLPIAVGRLPSQMISDLHAMQVKSRMTDLPIDALTNSIENLLKEEHQNAEFASCIAASPEMRADLLARYTRDALEHGAFGPMRQSGALSSFCLPDASPDVDIWLKRDGNRPRSKFLYERLHKERLAFEKYAKVHGCDLMLDPSIPFAKNGAEARRARLGTLLEALEDNEIRQAQAVVRKRLSPGSLTICGDWFCAESVTPRPGEGYQQTAFTWHAPTVLQKIREFDRTFKHHLSEWGVSAGESRESAIQAIKQEIAGIPE